MALLTIERMRVVRRLTGATVRVVFRDDDVTYRCVAADDEQGWCVLYVLDDTGARAVNWHTGQPMIELLTGDVVFVWTVHQKRHVWQWVFLRLMDHSWLPPGRL